VNKRNGWLDIECFEFVFIQCIQPCFIVEVAWKSWNGFTSTHNITLGSGNPNPRPITSLWTVHLVKFSGHKDAVEYPNPWGHFRVAPLIEKYDIALEAITSVRFITAHAIRAHIPQDIAVIDQVFMAIGRSDAMIMKLAEEL
jgi:hypothetical protein